MAEARSNGPELVWDANTLKYKRLLFPHLASWLPDEVERAQLCFAFEEEAKRKAVLLAAWLLPARFLLSYSPNPVRSCAQFLPQTNICNTITNLENLLQIQKTSHAAMGEFGKIAQPKCSANAL